MVGHVFSQECFIYGPKYRYKTRNVDVFLNYLYGQAKLSIWLTRKAKIMGKGSTNIVLTCKGLISAHLVVEFAYYELTGKLVTFEEVWCLNGILSWNDYVKLVLIVIKGFCKVKNALSLSLTLILEQMMLSRCLI